MLRLYSLGELVQILTPKVIEDSLAGVRGDYSLYLYGLTDVAIFCIKALEDLGIRPNGICDTAVKASEGKDFHGINIVGQNELNSIAKDAIVLITCSHFLDISKHLGELGFNRVFECSYLLNHCSTLEGLTKVELVKCQRFEHALKEKALRAIDTKNIRELTIPSIDLIVTERCTLKCADCANLMPYFKNPVDIELEKILSSLQTLSELSDQILELRILGGEPFLYNKIDDVLKAAISTNNAKKVIIYTNGTIVPKSETLTLLEDPKVFVEVTNYKSASKNLIPLSDILTRHGIAFTISPLPKTWDDSSNIIKATREKEELQEMFSACCAKYIFTLMHGNLYRCPFSASLDALKLENIDISRDYLKVHQNTTLSRESLRKYIYRETFVESCNFCQGRSKLLSRVSPARQAKKTRVPFEYLTNEQTRALKD